MNGETKQNRIAWANMATSETKVTNISIKHWNKLH